MNIVGFILEALAVYVFISAFRVVRADPVLQSMLSQKGKVGDKTIRLGGFVGRMAIAVALMLVGLHLVGAF